MISLENLHMKNVSNKLSFLLVTHTSCFDIQFGRYGILKLGFRSGQILDRLDIQSLIRFLGRKMSKTHWGLNTSS
jgi:hypothetical protein